MASKSLSGEELFKKEQTEAIKVAKQLCYPSSVIEELQNAKTVNQLDRILKCARGSR